MYKTDIICPPMVENIHESLFQKEDVKPIDLLSHDPLDYSRTEGVSTGQHDGIYQQLITNTSKISAKYMEKQTVNRPPLLHNVQHLPQIGDSHKTFENESAQTVPAGKIYQCVYCPYKSTRSCNLTSHLQIHYVDRHTDPTCSYCSLVNNYRIERMSVTHDTEMHPCVHCTFYSTTVHEAVQHYKSHLDSGACVCIQRPVDLGAETYEKNVDAKKNIDNCKHLKAFKCPHCSYIAKRSQNLKRHIITHTGERPHHCNVCPYRAPDVSSLRVHMKTHTGERPHECPHCPYRASQKSTLRNHIKIHTGEKPYACSHCSYKSSNQTNLNSHIKTHTGERPYACPHCSYCATQSSALKCHLRTHTGEKPFECSRCPYKAAALGNLRSHLKVHANEKRSEEVATENKAV